MEKHRTAVLKIYELIEKESSMMSVEGRKTLLDEVEKTFS